MFNSYFGSPDGSWFGIRRSWDRHWTLGPQECQDRGDVRKPDFLQQTDSGFCHRQCLYFIHFTMKKIKLTFKKDLEWNSISKTTLMLFMYLALLQAKAGGLWAKLRIPGRRGESSGSLAEARRFESGEERLVLRSHKGFCFWWGWVNIKWMDRSGISIIYIYIYT